MRFDPIGLALAAASTVAACASLCFAQVQLLPANPLASYSYYDSVAGGSGTLVAVTGQTFTNAIRITTAGTGTHVYDAQLAWSTSAPVVQGDLILLTFWARRIAPLDGRSIEAQVVMERNGGDYIHSLTATLPNDTSQWQRYAIPFRAAVSHIAGDARIAFQFSVGPQTFEIGGISAANYGAGVSPGSLSTSFYYPGKDATAPWRAAAQARIDQYRRGDLSVRVQDCRGAPVVGATVRATLTRNAFKFGTAVTADRIVGTDATSQTYRDKFLAEFNSCVIENHLKWPFWETWGQPDGPAALNWLSARAIPTRGHNLIWPNFDNMPGDCAALSSAAMRTRIDAHFTQILNATRGKIFEWDVVNEPYSSFDVQGRIAGVAGVPQSAGVLGNAEINHWFQAARAADENIGLVLNDYNVLEGVDPNHRAYTQALVSWMLGQGAPVQRLGLQGHFDNAMIAIPELEARLATLSTLPVRFGITEYDANTLDEQLQAEYLRDVLTLIYSQERFDEFMMWGFWEGAHWLPDAAMYRQNWTSKPAATVWHDLVRGTWTTDAVATTDGQGRIPIVRGYTGNYTVVATRSGGQTSTVGATLSTQGNTLVLTLGAATTCAADFNCSGGLSVQDIFDFLAAWFAGSLSADFNGSNGLQVQDVFEFLAAWFVGC